MRSAVGKAGEAGHNGAVRGRDFGPDDFGEDDDLVALERAEALLDHRDPDQAEALVAARRAAEEESKRREAQIEKLQLATRHKRKVFRRRLLVVGVTVAVLGLAAIPAGKALMHELARNEAAMRAVDAVARPAMAQGFKDRKDFINVPQAGVKLQIPRATCSAVIAVTEGQPGAAPVRIERAHGSPFESKQGIIWCSCEAEEVLARVSDNSGRRASLTWISSPMGDVGGAEALTFAKVAGFTVVSDGTGMACADPAFDLWSRRPSHGELAALPKDRKGITASAVAEGMEAVGMVPTGQAFGVVHSAQGYCYLVIPEALGSTMTVREQDGTRIATEAPGAFGWCSHAADQIYSVWPTGSESPAALVFRAQADRVGGLTGIHELALRRGAVAFRGHLGEDDLEPDVKATLIASSVNDATITVADAAGLPEKQGMLVTAFSLLRDGAYLPDAVPLVPYACFPRYEPKVEEQAYSCWQARVQRWRTEGKPKRQAAAQGPTPFWMSVLADVGDQGAVEAGAKLLTFARRMRLMGFEPTTVEGVRDTATGAVISGRHGQVDTVAVGITSTGPWVHPLTDARPWSLDGDIRIVQIPEGKTMTLHASVPLGGNASARRVVVWRR